MDVTGSWLAAAVGDEREQGHMPGALDRHGQGALLTGLAVGLAPVGDLAALVETSAQALDVLVIDDLARSEDRLLTATTAAAEPAATAAAAVAALAATGAIPTVVAARTIAARAVTTGTIAAAVAAATTGPIATAVSRGGTLGTGAEPGAGTLLAGRAGLLACLR